MKKVGKDFLQDSGVEAHRKNLWRVLVAFKGKMKKPDGTYSRYESYPLGCLILFGLIAPSYCAKLKEANKRELFVRETARLLVRVLRNLLPAKSPERTDYESMELVAICLIYMKVITDKVITIKKLDDYLFKNKEFPGISVLLRDKVKNFIDTPAIMDSVTDVPNMNIVSGMLYKASYGNGKRIIYVC